MAVMDDNTRLHPPMTRPAPPRRSDSAPGRQSGVPPVWRIWRLLLAIGLVLTGLAMIIVTVAFIYWPADLILGGAVLFAVGAFFTRLEPSPPQRRR